jgi:hypothetical protein
MKKNIGLWLGKEDLVSMVLVQGFFFFLLQNFVKMKNNKMGICSFLFLFKSPNFERKHFVTTLPNLDPNFNLATVFLTSFSFKFL